MNYERINSQTMKQINMQSVLNIVRKYETISRKDLVKKSKLTTGTITNLINELIKEGLVHETGSGKSEGGRKPILLQLDPNAGYVVGLELNTDQIVCVLSDFRGKTIHKQYCASEIDSGRDRVIDKMVTTIEDIISKNGIRKEQVIGIGLSVPGPFDDKKGVMINPPNLKDWKNVPIRNIIMQRTGIKTYTEKETQAAVLAEYWFGKSAGYQRIFYLNVYNIGIGGGFIMDGQLFHGSDSCCMDIGHTKVLSEGYPCSCGQIGCLEAHASGNAAVRYVKEALQAGETSTLGKTKDYNMDDVIRFAKQGDSVCVKAIEKCAYYLGIGLINIIGLLSPDAIVFGGYFMEKSDLLFEKTNRYLDKNPYFINACNIKRIRTSFGNDAGAIGGIATVFHAISEY